MQKSKKGLGKRLGGIALVIVGVLIAFGIKAGLANTLFGDKAAEAKVGDCIGDVGTVKAGEEKEASAKVVKCTDTDAAYTVVGRVEDQTEAQAETSTACEQFFKDGEEYAVYSSIPEGGKGYLLCLRPKA